MSRIGRQPIDVPGGVTVTVEPGRAVIVTLRDEAAGMGQAKPPPLLCAGPFLFRSAVTLALRFILVR